MAEYYVVLKKAIAGLDPTAGDARRGVYDKARNALIGQLKAIEPPLTTAEISRQRLELEEAIRRVEREATSSPAAFNLGAQRAQAAPQKASRQTEEDAEFDLDIELDLDAEPEPAPRRRAASPPPPEKRAAPRESFQRAVRDSERAPPRAYEPPPEEPADDPYDDYEEPEPEPAPPPPRKAARAARAELRADPPPEPEKFAGRAEPVLDQGAPDWAPAPDPVVERRPKPAREDRAARRPPRMPDRTAEEPRRKSRLPLIFFLTLVLLLIGGGAAFFYQVPEARQFAANVISSFDRPEKPAATATPASGEQADKTSDRMTGQDANDRPVRTVGGNQGIPAPAAGSGGSGQASPANGAGGGQSVAVNTPPAGSQGGAASAAGASAAVPVAQKVMLFEESTSQQGQIAASFEGTTVWRTVEGGPDGPVVEGTINVPDRKLRIQLTIRRNNDAGLPASHLVEIAVNTPPDHPGGGILEVPRLVLKTGESSAGQPIVGAPFKVVDGLFWIALSNEKGAIQSNMGLLRSSSFLDIPLKYKNGQRAILTLTKGEPGTRAFERALAAWGN